MEAFLPLSFPFVLPGFYSNLEYLFKEHFLVGNATKSSLFFLCHHYGVICADDMVTQIKRECCIEIYHNLMEMVGFKT